MTCILPVRSECYILCACVLTTDFAMLLLLVYSIWCAVVAALWPVQKCLIALNCWSHLALKFHSMCWYPVDNKMISESSEDDFALSGSIILTARCHSQISVSCCDNWICGFKLFEACSCKLQHGCYCVFLNS